MDASSTPPDTLAEIEVGDIVLVAWLDACHGPQGWHSMSEIPELGTCATAAWVVAVSEESIKLAGTVGWNRKADCVDADDMVGHTTTIPRPWIQAVERLRPTTILRGA